MITPFSSDIVGLGADEQLVLLKGCVLCQITRDLANGSTRNKPEWKSCKGELGVTIDVVTLDRADASLLERIARDPPAVFARTTEGTWHLLLDKLGLERCRGSVGDFRGRLMFRLAQLGLALPATSSRRGGSSTPPLIPSKRPPHSRFP